MKLWAEKTDPQELQLQGIRAFERGDLKSADQFLTSALDLESSSDRFYYRGVIRDMLGQPEKALADLLASTELDAKNVGALHSLALIYQELGLEMKAFRAIRKAYDISPDDARVANCLARHLIENKNSTSDLSLAVEASRRACEATQWIDAVCTETYELACKLAGESHRESTASPTDSTNSSDCLFTDFSQEVTRHFESRFNHKSNIVSLNTGIPGSLMPVSVQAIESKTGHGYSVAFTTGLSNRALMVSRDDTEFRFIELMMVIPAHCKPNSREDIWPWHSLQSVAYQAQKIGGFSGDPQVLSAPIEDRQNGFVAFLTLPRLRGYVDKLKTKRGRKIRFISLMPIFEEEYALACLKSVDHLVRRFQKEKIKPYYLPGRCNVAAGR